MARDQGAAAPTLALAPALDLSAAAALAASLRACAGAALRVEGSRVERLGGQCLQALLAAAVASRAQGVGLTLVDPSPRLLQDLALYGVEPADLESLSGMT